MEVSLVIDPWWVCGGLAYLLIGALGVLVYQSNHEPKDQFGFAGCLFWIIFWLPAGVVTAFFAVVLRGPVFF